MNDQRPRVTSPYSIRETEAIPESQARALERRHALDEQQRAYRKPGALTPSSRHRPPA